MVVNEIFLWVSGQLIVAAAIWGAIRTDIKNIHGRLDRVERIADHAHHRVDTVLQHRDKS